MKLESIRKKIDDLDSKLVEILSLRMKLVSLIKTYKKEGNLEVEDKKREVEILTKIKNQGINAGLKSQFLEKLMNIIFKESKSLQK